jgi:hypothetical protein
MQSDAVRLLECINCFDVRFDVPAYRMKVVLFVWPEGNGGCNGKLGDVSAFAE